MSKSSADISPLAGSSILGEPPPFPPSQTGLGGADLSLSELYISDRSEHSLPSEPFTLLPQRGKNDERVQQDRDGGAFNEERGHGREVEEGDITITNHGPASASATRKREEQLEHSLFVLKKLNSAFTAYNDALKDVKTSTETVAVQLDRTDRLLDQYVSLLQHTERNSKLLLDESWQGGEADQEMLEKLREEAAQEEKRQQEERERAVRLQRERQEREEEERRAEAEKEARQKDKRGSISVRGVRGLRVAKPRGLDQGSSMATRGRAPTTTMQTARGPSATGTRVVRKV